MDMLSYIISYMNAQVTAASKLFDNVKGLCDYEANDKAFYEYTGKGQGKPVTNYDAFNGTLLWVKRGDVTISPDVPVNFRDTGCKDYLTINYPLRAIGVVKKEYLPCDNSTAADQVGQELMLKLGGRDKVLRSQLQAMYAEIVPRGYSVKKELVNNLNYTAIYFDYDVRITVKQECLLPLCESVPLPPCEYTITLNNSDGETIYVITQDSENPFTLAPQPIVDGNGNAINVPYDPNTPYVTTPCEIECDDATVNVNGILFNTVASGGTINVPVEYVNGTPVGTITGGVVEIPNPIVCADATAVLKNSLNTTLSSTNIASGASANITAPDATAVLKDTDGNTLDTEAIPSNVSEDIIAPDGSITVNGVAFSAVRSGGTRNVDVFQETGNNQVGSKQGQHWRIDDSDVSINGVAFDSIPAEDSLNIEVEYANGTPVGSIVGGVWTIPNVIQTLVSVFVIPTGLTPLELQVTIDADSAGTYNTASFTGSVASATYQKNGSPATLPITVAIGDTLKVIPNAANGTVKLTGTY